MEEERTYINYWQAIEDVAYVMGVLQVFMDEMGKGAAITAYNRLARVMEALQGDGILMPE